MTFIWQWPQITWFCLAAFSLLHAAVCDGQPKNQKHSLALSMFAFFISGGILYFGGFFTEVCP